MELCNHLLAIHVLLCLFSFPHIAAKVITTSKTDLSALLSFKSQISSDPFGVLSSWNESFLYCQWQGVLCGRHHPDRVTALVLDSKQLTGSISPSLANLTFLQRISLSDNQFHGIIPVEIGYLNRLRFLNLSQNFIEGIIPSTFGNCSNLQVIQLRNNNLHGTIPPNIVQCKELENFSVRNNFLTGGIPPEFGQITQLGLLGLSGNNLTGTIPYTLGNLSSLMYLFLDQNDFNGHIPDSLGNLTSLLRFYAFQNSFHGHIPSTLGNLTNLLDLRLYQNKLSGIIPSSFGNLNNINTLYLDQNRLSGFMPAALGKLQNLWYFDIFDNNISGELLHSLFNISTMIWLELGINRLEGTLPLNMCDGCPNLQILHIYDNKLNGQIPQSISNCSALTNLQLDSNSFAGSIPSTIGLLQNLQIVTMRTNKLQARRSQDWIFLDAMANCTSLQFIGLGYNKFQGTLPSSIGNLSTSLHTISLSGNPISGNIPIQIGKLTNLNTLLLDNMLLNGTIPIEIGNLFKLELLDLSNNMITGKIPSTFGNLTKMEHLGLNSNSLEGRIPLELTNMQVLVFLNLSSNMLTGKIPKEIMVLPLSIILDLSHNHLTDFLPAEIGKLKNIQTIRLSNNKLFGVIPNTIDGCQVLQSLLLDSNMFEGVIPSSFNNMRGLQELDISNNSFYGQVPEFMGRMNLQHLNISFNNFEGELPKEGIFKNISGIDIRGNSKLCGGIPELHLKQCLSQLPYQRHNSQGKIILIISVVGSFICLTIGLYLLVICYPRKRHENNTQTDRVLKSELRSVSYYDLVRATENFASKHIIGRGTFGTVYKAIMIFENVTTVAVKVLNLEKHGSLRSFVSECETLRNVRHRNLIKVLSSCSSIDQHGNDFKALIFEFMPNGSLAEWLHPNENTYMDSPIKSLSLVQRLSIAIDVATALDYLHYHGPTPIVHCDLKPSNVLLDDDMTAHVGDFGLARFLAPLDTLPSQSLTTTSGVKGSIGYIPLEYGMGGRSSMEGDVYSYGILLLEMFTGVSPTNERLRDGVSLHKHVEMAFPEQAGDIIDSKSFSAADVEATTYALENVFDGLVSVIQCGLWCSKESLKERISIKDVVEQLNSAWTKLLPS
ncbi:Leucine-rich receptor-like protein kinase family protein [Rhynchospora pubera]|uniref:Receptor kinase-like protein Xa21 n=1 Tax=Rhynchospora pubera TaxID=906938 RepID=A0AAV8EHX7_9POAL|nr:Leucine-rich receptor-like protein kinase family protein [Rhynchospora pubera]